MTISERREEMSYRRDTLKQEINFYLGRKEFDKVTDRRRRLKICEERLITMSLSIVY